MNELLQDIVAIDGPAGAGKSSVARRVAHELNYAFLDTGATYRAATWWAVHNGVDLNDPKATAASTRRLPLEMHETSDGVRVLIGGRDVSEAIRTPDITRLISKLDHNPLVRERLVEIQRAIASKAPTVAEGRDMGTVVFPDARCKIYMDAAPAIRARRRARQLADKGMTCNLAQLEREIVERDHRDMTRPISPLRRAPDAVVLDTTTLSFEEVVQQVVTLARGTGANHD